MNPSSVLLPAEMSLGPVLDLPGPHHHLDFVAHSTSAYHHSDFPASQKHRSQRPRLARWLAGISRAIRLHFHWSVLVRYLLPRDAVLKYKVSGLCSEYLRCRPAPEMQGVEPVRSWHPEQHSQRQRLRRSPGLPKIHFRSRPGLDVCISSRCA